MDKKQLKVILISILVTSTLFNAASVTFADDGEEIDENAQEGQDMEDGAEEAPGDDNEVTTEDLDEGENLPAEGGSDVDGDVEEQPRETEAVLTPADHVEDEEAETLQEDTTQDESAPGEPVSDENSSEETASDEPVNEAPEDDGVTEEDGADHDNEGSDSAEQSDDASPPVDDDAIQEEEGNETNEESMPESEDTYDGGDDAGQAPGKEEGQPSQETDAPLVPAEPETSDAADEDPSVQTEQPAVEVEPDENHEVYGGSAEAQSTDDGSRDVQEHAREDVEVEAAEGARTGVAGKKLHRYNHGDILKDLDLSPGNSDESLALLDKRVNRIMGSKILEETEMIEEDKMVLEEEIKNETAGITSSNREILPNTGEANNYNFLYSVMLIISGAILFFMTKKPRQQ